MTEDNRRAWFKLIEGMRSTESEYEPPDEITSRVLSLAGTSPTSDHPPLRLASLVYDSSKDLRVAGVRRRAAPSRHLVCRVGSVELRVNVQPFASGQMSVAGQVSVESHSESVVGIDVWMECNERLLTTQTNDYGEFIFQGLPHAEYKIAVLLAAGSIILPPI